MSSASPDDLVVTFRSIPRRLREAHADTPPEQTAAATAELNGLLHEAGRMMMTTDEAAAIADAIAAMDPHDWDDETLARLRQIALDLGQLLRHIASLSGVDN